MIMVIFFENQINLNVPDWRVGTEVLVTQEEVSDEYCCPTPRAAMWFPKI